MRSALSIFGIAFVAASTFASPAVLGAARPSVTISNGTVVGSSFQGVDTFQGIPYAEPPLGQLRLRPPQVLKSNYGTLQATTPPKTCPQLMTSIGAGFPSSLFGLLENTPFGQFLQHSSEDCLTLNIQRPSSTTSSSALPVVVYFFGGGFASGGTTLYNGQQLVESSVGSKQSVVYVVMNYRLGGLGFLAGDELSREGATNLGLRDQRLALQWVQDNIAAFGGDPSKVTLFGESAGAISIVDHTVVNGGDNTYKGRPMFRGAILNSGNMVPAEDASSAKPQAVFDAVVRAARCDTASDKVECLRSLSLEDFLNAANTMPGFMSYQSLDLPYLPRPDARDKFFVQSPEVSIANGEYAKVPIISGDQEDEGTLFSQVQTNLTTSADLANYFTPWWPNATPEFIAGFVATYPDNPSAGSPYNTGSLYNFYPQQKRLAAMMADFSFTLIRRKYLSLIASEVKAWSFLATFDQGKSALGTFHGSDIPPIFASQQPPVTQTYLSHYVNFINNLDPNIGNKIATTNNWPQWSSAQPQLLNIGAMNNTLIPDNFRSQSYNYFSNSLDLIRI